MAGTEPLSKLMQGVIDLETPPIGVSNAKWVGVQTVCKQLADGLRTPNQDKDAPAELPAKLTSLLQSTFSPNDGIPHGDGKLAAYEVLRVVANLCMDHDGNRQLLLNPGAEVPQAISDMLKSYWDFISSQPESTTTSRYTTVLKTDDIKIVKTAFGALINASLGFEPVQKALVDKDTPSFILRISSRIYPPGAWASISSPASSELKDEWTWRYGLSQWAWKALESINGKGESESDQPPLLKAEDIPYLVDSLRSFIPPFPQITPALASDPSLLSSLIEADFEVLEEVSSYFEALPLTEDEVRTSLLSTKTGSGSPLKDILQFVEDGSPPPYLEKESKYDVDRWHKSFGLSKGGIVKAVVNISGEEPNLEILWDGADGKSEQGGWFVQRMVELIRSQSALWGSNGQRDDLIICATLVLGNMARTDSHCNALVQPPNSLVPSLVHILRPETDLKVKHGIVGLLKHLSQPKATKSILGDEKVLEAISKSKIWDRSADMGEVIQMSAIGVAKHLTAGNVSNTLRLFSKESTPTGLTQILELIQRTDTLALRSEATRVLVNVIKSLWSGPGVTEVDQTARQDAIKVVTSFECADAIAEMVGRSRKYPLLLNEGVVGLSLLASHPVGGPPVLRALNAALGAEEPSQRQNNSNAPNQTPVSTPLDMLRIILASPEGQFPPELKANSCSLLGELGRHQEADGVKALRNDTRSSLEGLAQGDDKSPREIVKKAAAAALEIWDKE